MNSDKTLRALIRHIFKLKYQNGNHQYFWWRESPDLVYDEKPDEERQGGVPRLPGDHVPLLRRGHQHLSGLDLRLRQGHVARQLTNLYSVRCVLTVGSVEIGENSKF